MPGALEPFGVGFIFNFHLCPPAFIQREGLAPRAHTATRACRYAARRVGGRSCGRRFRGRGVAWPWGGAWCVVWCGCGEAKRAGELGRAGQEAKRQMQRSGKRAMSSRRGQKARTNGVGDRPDFRWIPADNDGFERWRWRSRGRGTRPAHPRSLIPDVELRQGPHAHTLLLFLFWTARPSRSYTASTSE